MASGQRAVTNEVLPPGHDISRIITDGAGESCAELRFLLQEFGHGFGAGTDV